MTFGLLWINLGILAGAPMALGFLRSDWLGGYGSLDRRLLRLAHVAFIMLALLNIVYGLVLRAGGIASPWDTVTSIGLIGGTMAMPIVLLSGIPRRQCLWLLPVPFLLIAAATLAAGLGRVLA